MIQVKEKTVKDSVNKYDFVSHLRVIFFRVVNDIRIIDQLDTKEKTKWRSYRFKAKKNLSLSMQMMLDVISQYSSFAPLLVKKDRLEILHQLSMMDSESFNDIIQKLKDKK